MLPALQTKGITLNARAWWALSTTISATMVLITPTFPLSKPAAVRAIKACAYDFENPNTRVAETVPSKPKMTTGFRPYLSDNRPQGNPTHKYCWRLECAHQKRTVQN